MERKSNFNRAVFQFVKFLFIWRHYRNCFIGQLFLTVLWSHSPYIPSTLLTPVSFCLRSLTHRPHKKHYANSLLYSEEFSHKLAISAIVLVIIHHLCVTQMLCSITSKFNYKSIHCAITVRNIGLSQVTITYWIKILLMVKKSSFPRCSNTESPQTPVLQLVTGKP